VLALSALVPWNTYSQTPTTTPTQGTTSATPASSGGGVYSGREVFVPKDVEKKKDSDSGFTSFADGFLRNSKKHIGFSLSAFESYIPNDLSTSTGQTGGVAMTSFVPQIYTNFQKKQLAFRLNYGAVITRYNKDLSQFNRLSQTGSATFSYTVSHRNTRIQVTDYLNSFVNNPTSFLGSIPSTLYRLDGAPQIYVDGRRQTMNIGTISLNQAVTKKFGVSISESNEAFRYSGSDYTYLFTVGAGMDYQINKWMRFNLNYSHNLNYVGNDLRNNNFEHLQIAGFSFKLGKGWQLSSSGGVDSTKNGTDRFTTANGQASLIKTSRHTSAAVSYGRGYSTVFPSAGIWYGQTANLNVVQRLSSRMSVHMNSFYFRGSALGTYSLTSTVSGTAGLDFALQRNLIASTNYFLVSQKLGTPILTGTTLHQNTVSIGLQYYLPSVSGR
jgi:hypothetical protein